MNKSFMVFVFIANYINFARNVIRCIASIYISEGFFFTVFILMPEFKIFIIIRLVKHKHVKIQNNNNNIL